MTFNKLIFGGNLTGDPVIKPMGNGKLALFSLGSNRRRKDAEGNVKEEVCFIEVEAWGKQADICAQYLHKGESVLIEGRLRQSMWDDKNGGGKRSKHTLLCEEIVLLNPPKKSESTTPVSPTQVSPTPVKSKIEMIRDAGFGIKRIDAQQVPTKPLEDIEDLPF